MIKPLDAEATCSVIWLNDPAIDLDKSNLEEYRKIFLRDPGAWREHIVAKDGQQITEFLIGVIPPGELNRIEDQCGWGKRDIDDQTMRWLCFLNGLRDIKNGPTRETTDRESNRKKVEVPKVGVNGAQYVDREWLAAIFVRDLRQCANYIGFLAWQWNQIGDDEIKK